MSIAEGRRPNFVYQVRRVIDRFTNPSFIGGSLPTPQLLRREWARIGHKDTGRPLDKLFFFGTDHPLQEVDHIGSTYRRETVEVLFPNTHAQVTPKPSFFNTMVGTLENTFSFLNPPMQTGMQWAIDRKKLRDKPPKQPTMIRRLVTNVIDAIGAHTPQRQLMWL